MLEWIPIPFSRGTSQPRDWTLISCLTGRFSTIWATGKSKQIYTYWYIKGFCAVTKWDVFWECKTDLNIQKSNNAICHINRKKDKNHSILIKKQKISQTTRIRREVSNPQKKKKKIYKKLRANIYLMMRLNLFFPKIRDKTMMSTSTISIQYWIRVSGQCS